jgi:hypothetical protein
VVPPSPLGPRDALWHGRHAQQPFGFSDQLGDRGGAGSGFWEHGLCRISDRQLKELLGHTTIEVFVGALVGIVYTTLMIALR